MKDIRRLSVDIEKFSQKVIQNLAKAQSESADLIKEDVLKRAPGKSGKYFDSIKKSETEVNNRKITTNIYTDLKSKDGHFIGRMIENGTGIYALEPHIGHTVTFYKSDYNYWYVPAEDVDRPIGKMIEINGNKFYVVKAQKPKPHFKPALESNIAQYKENIRKAIKEAL